MEVEAVDEGTHREDRGAGRHAGRAGQRGDRGAGRRGRGREGGRRRGARGCAAEAPLRSAGSREAGCRRPRQHRLPPPQAAAPRRRPRRSRAAQANGHARVFSSPLARRLAKEAGIELARINGSGPHGRVIARDVEAAQIRQGPEGAGRRAGGAAPSIAPSMSRQADPRAVRGGHLRGRAARRHAPHHRAAADRVDADHPAFLSHDRLRHRQAARRARGDQRGRAEGQGEASRSTSSRSTTSSSRRWRSRCSGSRTANVSWTEGGMLKHKHSDVGVAVAMPGGLITPIIRKAETKIAVGDLQRDEGFRRARAGAQAQAARNTRAAPRRCPTSACTASRTSPP